MRHFASCAMSLLPLLVAAFPRPGVAAGQHPRFEATQGCVTPTCHAMSGQISGATGSVHDPVSRGDCRSCHDLALPPGAHFVREAPDGDGGGPGSAWDMKLCLGCHGDGLLGTNDPAPETGFADGKRNLHAHHVLAGRGRRCLSCHDPHAARQPKLLRERIPARGNARIAQQFRGAPNGGWCKTGCHAPKSYER